MQKQILNFYHTIQNIIFQNIILIELKGNIYFNLDLFILSG